jgi:hypothetical protein
VGGGGVSVTYEFGSGSYDLAFKMPVLSTGQYIEVKSNSAFTASDRALSEASASIRIGKTADGFEIKLKNNAGYSIEEYGFDYESAAVRVRIIVHNEFITVMFNSRWVRTFALAYVWHPYEIDLHMKASTNITVTEIVRSELDDWREVIAVDVETTGSNAVDAVIGRKPISMWARYDGTVCFAYDPIRETVEIEHVSSVIKTMEENDGLCSDAMIYSERVAVALEEEVLEDYGFITRLLRYADLEFGAIVAGKHAMEIAKQAVHYHEIRGRFKPEAEINDILFYDAVMGDDWSHVSGYFIAETMSVNITDVHSSSFGGRGL